MQSAAMMQGTMAAGNRAASVNAKRVDWAFRFLLLYMFIDYGRPMDQLPFLTAIRPGMIGIILLGVAWLFSSRKSRVKSPIILWFALFLCWMALHGLFPVNRYYAFFTTRDMGFLFLAQICMLSFVDDTVKLRKLYTFWVLISIYLGILGILKSGKAGSYFLGDENDFCLLMVTMLPFSYFPLLHKTTRKRKLFFVIALICCLGAIVASKSRGGFLGLMAVGAFCWWMSTKKIKGLVWATVGFVVLLVFAGPTYWEEMRTITNPGDQTRRTRFDTWKASTRVFLDHPLGVGSGSFPYAVKGYDIEFLERDRTIAGRAAHSVYFTLLPELGIPGVILFIGLIFSCFRLGKRTRKNAERAPPDEAHLLRDLTLSAIAGMVGVLVAGTFISVLYYPHLWYLCGFIATAHKLSTELPKTEEAEQPALELWSTRFPLQAQGRPG